MMLVEYDAMTVEVEVPPMPDGSYAILRDGSPLVCGLSPDEAARFRAKFAQMNRLRGTLSA